MTNLDKNIEEEILAIVEKYQKENTKLLIGLLMFNPLAGIILLGILFGAFILIGGAVS